MLARILPPGLPDFGDSIPFEGPPAAIENLVIVHGWTLTPDKPEVFKNTARHMAQEFNVRASVPAMPNTDNPVPEEWEDRIDEEIADPASTILVAQSLAGMNALRHIAKKKAADPTYELGGLVVVAANVTPVGFPELEAHFDPRLDRFTALTAQVARSVRAIALLYGAHDPFVELAHGLLLAYGLGTGIYVDPNEAHFSDEYRDDKKGIVIPPCTFNRPLAIILSKMIMDAAPKGRYGPERGVVLPTYDMLAL